MRKRRPKRCAGDVAMVRRCRLCNLEQNLVVNTDRNRKDVGVWITRDDDRVDAVIARWTLKHFSRVIAPLGLTPKQVEGFRRDWKMAEPFNPAWKHSFRVEMSLALGVEPDYHPARPGGSVGWHARHEWRKSFDPFPISRTEEDRPEPSYLDREWGRPWRPEDDREDDERDAAA